MRRFIVAVAVVLLGGALTACNDSKPTRSYTPSPSYSDNSGSRSGGSDTDNYDYDDTPDHRYNPSPRQSPYSPGGVYG